MACLQVATAVLEPGNTVLCVHSLLEHIDLTLTYDTEVFCDIYRCNFDIESPLYELSAKRSWP